MFIHDLNQWDQTWRIIGIWEIVYPTSIKLGTTFWKRVVKYSIMHFLNYLFTRKSIKITVSVLGEVGNILVSFPKHFGQHYLLSAFSDFLKNRPQLSCQMVYFQTKDSTYGKYCRAL
jgi:hypothetical protein